MNLWTPNIAFVAAGILLFAVWGCVSARRRDASENSLKPIYEEYGATPWMRMSLYKDFLFLKSLFSRVKVPLGIITETEHKKLFFRNEIMIYYRVIGTDGVTFVHFSSFKGDRMYKEISSAVAEFNKSTVENSP